MSAKVFLKHTNTGKKRGTRAIYSSIQTSARHRCAACSSDQSHSLSPAKLGDPAWLFWLPHPGFIHTRPKAGELPRIIRNWGTPQDPTLPTKPGIQGGEGQHPSEYIHYTLFLETTFEHDCCLLNMPNIGLQKTTSNLMPRDLFQYFAVVNDRNSKTGSQLAGKRVLRIGYQWSKFNEAVEGVLASHPANAWPQDILPKAFLPRRQAVDNPVDVHKSRD